MSTMSEERKHGWDKGQVASFAKEFANSREGRSWFAFVPEVREALLTHFVALKVTGNYRPVTVGDMFALRSDIASRLVSHHKMAIETAEDA